MFIDRTKVHIKAGNGGDGMIGFLREKFVDKGGPAGGDGGRGGSVYFIADSGLTTLLDFRYNKKIIGQDGEKGKNKNQYGKYGEDIIIKVPVGTVVINASNGRIIADLKKANQKELIAKGGRGGRGNAKFVSSTNQVPRVAENGEKGEEFDAILELKLLADVGLVGYPSVGKSTFLSVVTAARPEIADYHFTTIVPNLGVVKVNDGSSFVIADLPGLIEGASQGRGLGLQFLRHIERCKVLINMVDISMKDGRNPIDDFRIINEELKQYKLKLLDRPMVIACNKMDDDGAILILDEFKKVYGNDYEIFPISCLTHEGIDKLLYRVNELVKQTTEFSLFDDEQFKEQEVLFKYEDGDDKGFIIRHPQEHLFVIEGKRIEKLYHMTNISDDQGLLYLTNVMRKMGIDDELERMGIQEGDTVKLCDFEFEYYD
ncbi:MAG: GTPase ObgE [Bacilli bacterium]|nr:GTPase ObgE [Bacilli bacterium]